MFETERYITRDGVDVLTQWQKKLKDTKAKFAIVRRIARMESGNFGDHKPVRDGVWELRIDVGPGSRLYYAQEGKTLILLLCGGSKRTQAADIAAAVAYWQDWQSRQKEDDEKPIQ
jgi:putative addiction module killer protein